MTDDFYMNGYYAKDIHSIINGKIVGNIVVKDGGGKSKTYKITGKTIEEYQEKVNKKVKSLYW